MRGPVRWTPDAIAKASEFVARLHSLEHAIDGLRQPGAEATLEVSKITGWRKVGIPRGLALRAAEAARDEVLASLEAMGVSTTTEAGIVEGEDGRGAAAAAGEPGQHQAGALDG